MMTESRKKVVQDILDGWNDGAALAREARARGSKFGTKAHSELNTTTWRQHREYYTKLMAQIDITPEELDELLS